MAVKQTWRGREVTAQVKDAAIKALQSAGEFILDRSNAIAPIDEGNLIRSGGVSVNESDLSVYVFYDKSYAVRQHEDMSLRHKNGRRAKFLEIAAKENTDRVRDYIEEELKKVTND